MKIKILHLYPKEMNLYGDHGNVLAIKRRCEWRNIDVEVIEHEPDNKIPKDIDIILERARHYDFVLTTEKDMQRLCTTDLAERLQAQGKQLVALPMKMRFCSPKELFDKQILTYVHENTIEKK